MRSSQISYSTSPGSVCTAANRSIADLRFLDIAIVAALQQGFDKDVGGERRQHRATAVE